MYIVMRLFSVMLMLIVLLGALFIIFITLYLCKDEILIYLSLSFYVKVVKFGYWSVSII